VAYRPGDLSSARLVAADTRRDRQLWATAPPQGFIPTQVLRVPSGPVLLYAPGDALVAYNAATGARLWRRAMPWPPRSRWEYADARRARARGTISLVQGDVLLLTPTDLTLVEPRRWERRWSLRLSAAPVGGDYRMPSALGRTAFVIVDEAAQDQNHRRLVAVGRANGRKLWNADLGPAPIVGRPEGLGRCSVAQSGVVCVKYYVVGAYESVTDAMPKPRLTCFDPASGRIRWQQELPGWPQDAYMAGDASPGICGGHVFMTVWVEKAEESKQCVVYRLADGKPIAHIPGVSEEPVVVDASVLCWTDHGISVVRGGPLEFGDEVRLPDLLPDASWRFGGARAGYGIATQSEFVRGEPQTAVALIADP